MPQYPDRSGRHTLPMPDVPATGKIALDARNAEFPAYQPLRPPAGAPNVVIVLIDDMGAGAPSAVGGPCQMPAMERVASKGLAYNRFHTTALCSPTRQALLTGRNHHSAGMGSVCEVSTGAPGNDSVRPNTVATVAEMLRHNGYSTAAFGKMHQTPVWEVSASGPFDRWPTGDGSNGSSASSAARPTSGRRPCTRAPRRSSRWARRPTATTSPRTWSTRPLRTFATSTR